jgi:hypothetical protein
MSSPAAAADSGSKIHKASAIALAAIAATSKREKG